MTVREIQAFLAEMYAVEVPPDLISTVAMVFGVVAGMALQLPPIDRRNVSVVLG